MTYAWLGLLVVCVVVEALTLQITTCWFALGALAALILSCIQGIELPVQLVAFVVVSALGLLLLRPLTRRRLSVKKEATNADRVISQVGVVTEDIDNLQNTGAVKVAGKLWTARSFTGEPIGCDERVVVRFIEGVKLIVELVVTRQSPPDGEMSHQ